MAFVDVDDFDKQMECVYKGERYSVRDNGAVLRHSREGKRPRPTDNKWTFGKPNEKTGYMEIAAVRVHRIVATAFHGEPPNPEYVVDHIDTNRRNNRPENLRWLTRLENALNNPITRRRIELVCGSIEAFLADPSKLRQGSIEPHFEWMRTVSLEEARASLERFQAWAKSDKKPSGGSLGEWVFKSNVHGNISFEMQAEPPSLIMAKTKGAAQRDWRVPSEFPYCPQKDSDDPLLAYAENLPAGSIFCRNEYYQSAVLKFALSDDHKILWIMSESCDENPIKPWALAEITYEDGLYVHTNLGSFFGMDGAEKQFTLAQGLEWTGGDTFDDYC
jgi:hypothetical protein